MGFCNWTGGNSSKSFYTNSYDSEGKGWHLNASLSASGSKASATVSPSIYGEKAFTTEIKFSGIGNVRAKRYSGSRPYVYYCDTNYTYCADANPHCPGHTGSTPVDESIDQNTDSGEEQTIVAVVGKDIIHEISGIKVTNSNSTSFKVSVEVYDSTNIGANYTHSDGVTIEVKAKRVYSEYKEKPDQGQGQSASVISYPTVNSEANTSFAFQGTSDSNSVSYTAP